MIAALAPYLLALAIGCAASWFLIQGRGHTPHVQGAAFQADPRLIARQRHQRIMKTVLVVGSSVSGLFLVVMLWQIIGAGWDSLARPTFWTNTYRYLSVLNGTGGLLDSIYATFITLIITLLFAVPVGTAAGIYLQEYSSKGRFFRIVEASVANLAAVPSIVFGLFGLAVFVGLLGLGASYIAAGFTLGTLILPMLIVSTQEALKNVPQSIRHASDALGASKWQTIRSHVLPYALPNILTGQILALSRAAGETAPLIALGIPLLQTQFEFGPFGSGSPLQLRAFYLAGDPNQNAIALAGGAVLLLMLLTLLLNAAAIVLRERIQRRIKW